MKIKILKMRPTTSSDVTMNLPVRQAGEAKNFPFIKINKKILGAVAGDKKILVIDELQPEGKRVMTAEAFINGYWR